jgi:hypothetical protein
MLRRRWQIDHLLGRAARLNNRRFPPEFLDAFVNNRQGRRETCKQEEEKIKVGMVPIHVQLPLDSRQRPAALRPRNGDPVC